MAVSGMPKAFSYIRFSTPEQRLGDSLRRQLQNAEKWCKKEGLELDSSLRDEGVSGFRRRNATEGALGLFLAAIRAGEVDSGSVLIIESLDRLSRAEPLDAFDQLREIVKAGVEVVTLHDGQRYTRQTLRDIGPLMMALVHMSKAHLESYDKSKRISETWAEKRVKAQEGRPMTRQVPGWIKVVGVRSAGSRYDWSAARFEVIEERAAIVREMFEKRASGQGRRRITSWLNDSGIEPWGRGKRRAKGGWQDSYIHKILTSRAVLGEYRPHVNKEGKYSARVAIGEPIQNYYPAIVSPQVWAEAQVFNVGARPLRGRPSGCLLTGLLADENDSPMHVERKGGGSDYLATAKAFRRKGQAVHRWRLDHLEKSVLKIAVGIDWDRVLTDPKRTPEIRRLKGELAILELDKKQLTEKIQRVASAYIDGLGGVGDAIKKAAVELDRELLAKNRLIVETKTKLGDIEAAAIAASAGSTKLKAELEKNLSDPLVRRRLQRELKNLIRRIKVWPDAFGVNVNSEYANMLFAKAEEGLTGNRGMQAKESGKTIGTLLFEFTNGKSLLVWIKYRRFAKSLGDPEIIGMQAEDWDIGDLVERMRYAGWKGEKIVEDDERE